MVDYRDEYAMKEDAMIDPFYDDEKDTMEVDLVAMGNMDTMDDTDEDDRDDRESNDDDDDDDDDDMARTNDVDDDIIDADDVRSSTLVQMERSDPLAAVTAELEEMLDDNMPGTCIVKSTKWSSRKKPA